MKSIIADVTTRSEAMGGLPWGLWHDIFLTLRPAGFMCELGATVREIKELDGWCDGATNTVHFELDEQNTESGSMEAGICFEIWFARWQHVEQEWQKQLPVADGVVTYVLS